jgi:hypothetical protein
MRDQGAKEILINIKEINLDLNNMFGQQKGKLCSALSQEASSMGFQHEKV